MSLIAEVHDLAMKFIVFLPLTLYLLIQLLYLDLLAIHLGKIRSEANLTLQVTDLGVLALNIVAQIIELPKQVFEILRVILKLKFQ